MSDSVHAAHVVSRIAAFMPIGVQHAWLDVDLTARDALGVFLLTEHFHALSNRGEPALPIAFVPVTQDDEASGALKHWQVDSLVRFMVSRGVRAIADDMWPPLLRRTFGGSSEDESHFNPSCWSWTYGPMAEWVEQQLVDNPYVTCSTFTARHMGFDTFSKKRVTCYHPPAQPSTLVLHTPSTTRDAAWEEAAKRCTAIADVTPKPKCAAYRITNKHGSVPQNTQEITWCRVPQRYARRGRTPWYEIFSARDGTRSVVVHGAESRSIKQCDRFTVLTPPTDHSPLGAFESVPTPKLLDLSGCRDLGAGFDTVHAREDVVLPAHLKAYSVSTHMEVSRLDMTHMTALETMLGIYATDIKEILLPHSLTYIATGAMQGCTEVRELDLSGLDRLRAIDGIEDFRELRRLVLPKNLRSVGARGLKRLHALKTMDLSPCTSLEEMWGGVECHNLDQILFFPASLKLIGDTAFTACASLVHVDLSDTHVERVLGFARCTSLGSIRLPPSVKEIGQVAFSECRSLKAIDLSTTGLEDLAGFSGCTNLASIDLPPTLLRIHDTAFANCTALKMINLEVCSRLAVVDGFSGCSWLDGPVALPPSVTFMGRNAFSGCPFARSDYAAIDVASRL